MGETSFYPSTGNKYSLRSSLIAISLGGFFMGTIQGVIEIFWFKKIFNQTSFWAKLILKSLFYLFFIFIFLISITFVNNSYLYNAPLFAPVVINSMHAFITEFSFWSIIIYIGIILDIALFYSEIKDYIGENVLSNYLGKYHKPKQETRIFMFLDMKSSTSIAESLGHQKYFELLQAYYADMTSAILETSGEVYQYVGDEIVVTWTEVQGLYKNNCLRCFSKITQTINSKKDDYITSFGLIPEFKAGYHTGVVTVGNIGIIRKELIYTGDILNTAARIQEECNSLNSKILISEELAEKLEKHDKLSLVKVKNLLLRGKKQAIQLYQVNLN